MIAAVKHGRNVCKRDIRGQIDFTSDRFRQQHVAGDLPERFVEFFERRTYVLVRGNIFVRKRGRRRARFGGNTRYVRNNDEVIRIFRARTETNVGFRSCRVYFVMDLRSNCGQ